MTINQQDKSTSINTQMDTLIPASKISNLTQGVFVGAISDNFDERIEQKISHAEIVVDNEKVTKESSRYLPIPVITNFTDEDGKNHLQEEIEYNYRRIKDETAQIIVEELARIKNNS
jgi:DNA-binding GntR family transcriptional regulator